MAKNDAISELTAKLLDVVNASKLSTDDKKKALWRAETQVLKALNPTPKKEKAVKKEKPAKKKKAKKE
jgi:hypothetical protein